MNAIAGYLRSVGDVWCVWLACAAALGWSLARAVGRPSLRRLAAFAADERGATYVLPYMLTFPVYLMVMCCMIQATMILMVKMGSMQAASAAARAAAVWRSAHPTTPIEGVTLARRHALGAAVTALAPFASGHADHQTNLMFARAAYRRQWSDKLRLTAVAPLYQSTYSNIVGDSIARDKSKPVNTIRNPDEKAPNDYVRRKFIYATWATHVAFDEFANQWNQPLEVTVTYAMPMHIPGAGRIMGQFHLWGFFHSREIVSKATVPLETPKSDNRLLGIKYHPSELLLSL
ncbi:MAG TPA: hypothetical protein PJ982_08070 [Lacipirellulaceae bacterium]|nr:hypothetical protein [Lacipirellulaceae bacterium]